MDIREGLTFDDVLLVPQHSNIESRGQIDISVKMGPLTFSHPIIPANMLTVTGRDMASAVIESGGLAILNRFLPIAEQIFIAENAMEMGRLGGKDHFAVSVGVKEEDKNNLKRFEELGVRIVCVDVAHGDSKLCVEMTSWIKKTYPNMFIISGNVATGNSAVRLWRAGADAVKVGVGPGSLCTTRIETGNGVPQLTALMNVSNTRLTLSMHGHAGRPLLDKPMYIIADGGIKNSGDVVKSLVFAHMVMAGNLFAGCDEAPGTLVTSNGSYYKQYVGSSTHKTNYIEGVAALVPHKGSYRQVLTKLLEGLRSGMSYQGVDNLNLLKENPEFIRITGAGLRESHPHDVILK